MTTTTNSENRNITDRVSAVIQAINRIYEAHGLQTRFEFSDQSGAIWITGYVEGIPGIIPKGAGDDLVFVAEAANLKLRYVSFHDKQLYVVED